MSETAPFGIVLTGGASRRMGRDKAAIEIGGVPLAHRAATLVAGVTSAAVEAGPGCSDLPSVLEEPAGAGPLAAVVAGWRELVRRHGAGRPAIVLACDLPEVPAGLLAWLAEYPGDASVVPVVASEAQPLCARWSVADLERAAAQLAAGERSVRHVFGSDAVFVDESDWGAVATGGSLADVDTPDDLARRALAPPPDGDDWIGLGRSPLPTELASAWAVLARCGAVVTFIGTVRDHAEGRAGVEELTYEAYEQPALDRMAAVAAEARRRWPDLGRVALLHRVGRLSIGETAVTVVASAGHRHEAFAAGGFLIDTVKETVPIWKYERWSEGQDWGTCAQPVRPVRAT